ncbi:MAG: CRTAC1 family protein [Acidobacteria bacterium]|nr:CRTAC1 family protein [Acidobacteriota bacterium]
MRFLVTLTLSYALAAPGPVWTPQALPMVLKTGETLTNKPLPATMPGGLAIFDFDCDGQLDLFFTNGGDFPSGRKLRPDHANRLFRNLGAMRFADVTTSAGLSGTDYSFGATAGDFDADGHTDLLVSGLHGVTLYRNRGNGTFADVTRQAGLAADTRWAAAAAWFDKDNDGDLDLVVIHYVAWDANTERKCIVDGKPDFCHPRHYAATTHSLYENQGKGVFADVSEAAGFNAHPGKGMSVALADFDGDGFTDLFIPNDRVFNQLFLSRNQGKRFEESAFAWGVAAPLDGNPPSSMGTDAQDFDHDGRPDIIYSALRDETFPLYRNTGSSFEEVTAPTRLNVLSRLMAGWGILFSDLDNDGEQDILVARSDALSVSGGRGQAAKEPPSWFRQIDGRFENGSGWEALPRAMWRGAAAADLNKDGCLDVVLTALEASPKILRNPCTGPARWLAVDVQTPGARIRVGNSQWRFVSSASGYSSSIVAPQHFGLGDEKSTDVEVIWPGGATKLLKTVPVNRIIQVPRP